MKPKFIAIIVLIFLAAGLVFWKIQIDKKNYRPEVFSPKTETPPESLGSELYEKTQNPVQDAVPETNPFKETGSNPLEESYKNPFE